MVEQANVCFEHGEEIAWKSGGECPACVQIKKIRAEIINLTKPQKVKENESKS